ncbi:cytochrome P450 [Aspergillus ruber CBS 135680]|uniref:Cytochrome P450 monooxygenase n=1 Tax=Aspergillus ruber (strain CBS 135680) TaxID=1388766 RepID=A0A017S6S6_ASPRC|nr:cytochrome P450 monooxygenase [Aspergillus ruber CBS 135680]EYE92329.1 cytochrome P450 monooxygenase [Aspergillus ruber CBS 135680]
MSFGQAVLSQITVAKVILGLLAYAVLRVVYQVVYYRFFHSLSAFPGPFWGSVTRFWIAWHNLKETEVPTVHALTKKYGPVVRITPTMLLVSDPKKLPEVYHRRADKTSHYITGSFGESESLFNMRGHKTHATFRKHVAGPYSFSNMKKMEPLVDAHIAQWDNQLKEKFAKTGATFDFSWWAVYLVYDIISEIGFGAPFGFIKQGKDIGGLVQGFHDGLPAFGLLARLYPFTNWMKSTFLKKYLVATPADDSGIGVLMRFRDSLIDQRLKDIEDGKKITRVDLLQTFLEARTEDGKPLDMEYIRAETLLVLLAGADTTGTAFQAMIQYLLKNPESFKRMRREIDEADDKNLLSAIPQYNEVIEHLPFYVACVKEAMRLCPSAPNIFPRYVSDPGLELYGKFVAPGNEISCNPYLVQRDPELYGEDAEEYRPERWLDPERAKLYNKYNFAFGYGSRVCLGKDIAMMELYKGPLQFLRKYDLEVPQDKPAPQFCVKGGVGFWRDVWLNISKRP